MGFTDGYKTYDTSKGFGNARKWKRTFYERITEDEAKATLANQESTPYEILGLTERATQAEIKSAFRQLMMKWHPDRNPNNPDAEAMSKKIIAAYSILYKG